MPALPASPRAAALLPAGEYADLLVCLRRIHGDWPGLEGGGLMLQDISSNNLLVKEEEHGACRLLLADPSVAGIIAHLATPEGCASPPLLLQQRSLWAQSSHSA